MENYIKLKNIADYLDIKKGDRIFISSDIRQILMHCLKEKDDRDVNVFIDSLQKKVGREGTILFPVYNWDFCKGITFDYYKTYGKTGALGKAALKRNDFKRTKHPIYSFAVWGADQEFLCNMNNIDAFGEDSPFQYMVDKKVKNIIIDLTYKKCFTFVHYVEEKIGVSYRYIKNFTADYIDEKKIKSKRTYSMFVRDLELNVATTVDPFEEEFLQKGIAKNCKINGIEYKIVDIAKTVPIITRDIIYNRARRIGIYKGQDNLEQRERVGEKIYELAGKLFPICRSITGNGVRETLKILSEFCENMKIQEVPSGTRVGDWTIPKEWNIEDGYIENEAGERVLDFQDNNLHIMGYSLPMDQWMELEDLKKIIYTSLKQPEVIPYVTSYYSERSGFCMSENSKNLLPLGRYHAVIKSTLKDGYLTYGEILIPGESEKEIFISSYICHPSMANNECSGPSVLAYLVLWLQEQKKRRYTYRIVFAPETIGSITYISRNLEQLKKNVIAGFTLSCVGDNRTYSMVESIEGDTLADRVMKNVLQYHYPDYQCRSFLRRGSDERQYNAPGVELPYISFCRSKYGEYPEYHTSADNMSIVSSEGFQGSFDVMKKCIMALEYNFKYKVTCYGEPQLGKRNLYPTISYKGSVSQETMKMRNLIAYCNGNRDLIEISNRINTPIDELIPDIQKLLEEGLLVKEYK